MRNGTFLSVCAAILWTVPVQGEGKAQSPSSEADVLASSPAEDWRAVSPENLLMIEFANDVQVAIELAPDFAPIHIENIRNLVRSGWFGTQAIVRSRDNFVVQWGDLEATEGLPPMFNKSPPMEFERVAAGLAFRKLDSSDSYAPGVGYVDSWPVAKDDQHVWLTHCYGIVGVGRGSPPDTGTGVVLYTVIGHAPRFLDRNLALVGRVIDGMPGLATMPRAHTEVGYYPDPAQNIPIRSAHMATDIPVAQRPSYEVMRTDSKSFSAYMEVSMGRKSDFFVKPGTGVDICAVSIPVRKVH